ARLGLLEHPEPIFPAHHAHLVGGPERGGVDRRPGPAPAVAAVAVRHHRGLTRDLDLDVPAHALTGLRAHRISSGLGIGLSHTAGWASRPDRRRARRVLRPAGTTRGGALVHHADARHEGARDD